MEEINNMLEKGELLTLDDDREYAVAALTIIDNIEYVFLMDTEDYSNFLICSYDNNDGLEDVDDQKLLQELIKIFDEQLNGEK